VVTEVGGDDEAWRGCRFLTKASDGDRGVVEDTTVERGWAAFKETLDLVTCSQGCPSSAGALEGEALGEGLGCAATATECDGPREKAWWPMPMVDEEAAGAKENGWKRAERLAAV
jgi:hypothetical protein